ncbi:MAG: hypothetical protein ACLR7U_13160 [Ruthenibacterium lactatiformans]
MAGNEPLLLDADADAVPANQRYKLWGGTPMADFVPALDPMGHSPPTPRTAGGTAIVRVDYRWGSENRAPGKIVRLGAAPPPFRPETNLQFLERKGVAECARLAARRFYGPRIAAMMPKRPDGNWGDRLLA